MELQEKEVLEQVVDTQEVTELDIGMLAKVGGGYGTPAM
ncbi:hypothetical protein SBBP1_380017 [Burkholderiales bacterium]|nr:hypothetical protein SBBP1_380017 [Burkholderiales bacterium]